MSALLAVARASRSGADHRTPAWMVTADPVVGRDRVRPRHPMLDPLMRGPTPASAVLGGFRSRPSGQLVANEHSREGRVRSPHA